MCLTKKNVTSSREERSEGFLTIYGWSLSQWNSVVRDCVPNLVVLLKQFIIFRCLLSWGTLSFRGCPDVAILFKGKKIVTRAYSVGAGLHQRSTTIMLEFSKQKETALRLVAKLSRSWVLRIQMLSVLAREQTGGRVGFGVRRRRDSLNFVSTLFNFAQLSMHGVFRL